MAAKRVILEMGSGNDLHGGDYTKAALRAVEDAIHHSSLTLFSFLKLDPAKMEIEATIGVTRPERIDTQRIRQAFPHGKVTVRVLKGGLDVPLQGCEDVVIASAAIAVKMELPNILPADQP